MSTPLEIAVDIGRLVTDAQQSSAPLDICVSADDLVSRHPHSGITRAQISDALREEAEAIGVPLN